MKIRKAMKHLLPGLTCLAIACWLVAGTMQSAHTDKKESLPPPPVLTRMQPCQPSGIMQ